jgi:hypothetical protein
VRRRRRARARRRDQALLDGAWSAPGGGEDGQVLVEAVAGVALCEQPGGRNRARRVGRRELRRHSVRSRSNRGVLANWGGAFVMRPGEIGEIGGDWR